MSDRDIFNQVVYTPLSEALLLLEERRKDSELMGKVEKLLKGEVPEFFKNKKCGILSRHVATPNQESIRFISIAKEHDLYPVFFEYHDDKFTSNNEFKHSLGQLHIPQKNNKKNESNIERITIVDFNIYNGKKLKDVKTLWSEPLVEFHRKLFAAHDYKDDDINLYDASVWFKKNGGKAIDYYTNLLLMFTCYGVFFENFLTSKNSEGDFTENIVLPAIENVMNLVGIKPLIVPLEPIDLETEPFWVHHFPKIRAMLPKNKHANK